MRHKIAPQITYSFEETNKWDIRGLYSSNANTIKIWLLEHNFLSDILKTIEHEALHAGLDFEDFIEEEEHDMINKVQQIQEDMIEI